MIVSKYASFAILTSNLCSVEARYNLNKTKLFNTSMFSFLQLKCRCDMFESLQQGVDFETFSKSRLGAILVIKDDNDSTPIVRTTTVYKNHSQIMSAFHLDLIKQIHDASDKLVDFNNAMIEVYSPEYTRMGFHSDQSLDLVEGSWICIFSCYENPQEEHSRVCIIKNKSTGVTSEIIMKHNSCILFDTETNQKYVHKIISKQDGPKSRWLGFTLRLSKSKIYCKDGINRFVDDTSVLEIANESQRKEFFKFKSLENLHADFIYPRIQYTLSNH